LADDAAIDAGVTVVASSGDAGTTGTVGSPSSSARVFGVAATTTFRSYQQEGFAGVQLSNGTWASGNISSPSSGGVTQQARVAAQTRPSRNGQAGSTVNSACSVRSVSRNTQAVGLPTRTVGKGVSNKVGSVTLDTPTAPAYIDSLGTVRSYVKQTFSVPLGVD